MTVYQLARRSQQFPFASEAAQALLEFESATLESYQYEINALFDGERMVTGYVVLVKNEDGFSVGYVAEA